MLPHHRPQQHRHNAAEECTGHHGARLHHEISSEQPGASASSGVLREERGGERLHGAVTHAIEEAQSDDRDRRRRVRLAEAGQAERETREHHESAVTNRGDQRWQREAHHRRGERDRALDVTHDRLTEAAVLDVDGEGGADDAIADVLQGRCHQVPAGVLTEAARKV